MGISIYGGAGEGLFVTNERVVGSSQKAEENKNGNGKTFFAGNMVNDNSIELKKKLAQKRAMKIVSDAFTSEQDIDKNMDELRKQQQQLKQEALADKKEMMEIPERRRQLMSGYGVTEDSREHQDLELLRKERDAKDPETDLTEEEKERLEEIHANGITDYQKDMLELDSTEKVYTERIAKKEKASKLISESLSDIEIERLKTHPILDAEKQADKIMKAANKELIGDLLAEARDHIDEKMEEAQEKAKEREEAEEKAEENKEAREKDKEELEKQIEKIKENASNIADAETAGGNLDISGGDLGITDAPIHRAIEVANTASNVKVDATLEKMAEELQLLMDDLKGIKINMNL